MGSRRSKRPGQHRRPRPAQGLVGIGRRSRRWLAVVASALAGAGILMGAGMLRSNTAAEASTVAGPGEARPITAWVANYTSNTVTPVDAATQTAGNPIRVESPVAVAVTPDGSTLYVVDNRSGTVTPVDTASRVTGTPIEVGGEPNAIAMSPDGATVYVSDFEFGSVTLIDTRTNTVRSQINTGKYTDAIAISPDGSTLYVAEYPSYELMAYNAATGVVDGYFLVDQGVTGIAVSPNGTTVWVANDNGTVTPFNAATRSGGTPIPVGHGPSSLAVSPDGLTVYVVNAGSDSVTVIDTASRTAGSPIPVSLDPGGIAFTPDGSTAYVGCFECTGPVWPINTASETTGPPINAGPSPTAIAITPGQAPRARLSVTAAAPGEPTSLDASASTVANGTIASYRWDFGDGSNSTTTATPTVTHTYTRPGVYYASVTETSSNGTSTTVVSTGQAVVRNGGPHARATAEVDIKSHLTLNAATISKLAAVKAGVMTFSAQATNDTTRIAVPGISLKFTVKTQYGHLITCSGVTNAQGRATCSSRDGNLLLLRTPWTYTVTFAGNQYYYPSSATGGITR